MEDKKSMTYAERARIKLGENIREPISFSQIYDLEKAKRAIERIWKNNKEVWLALEKCRMYSSLVRKEKEWNDFWEENKFSLNIKNVKTFYASLKLRECLYCGNPFKEGRADRLYCSDTCKTYASREGLTRKSTAIDK